MGESSPREEPQRSAAPRPACTECQRRKQKVGGVFLKSLVLLPLTEGLETPSHHGGSRHDPMFIPFANGVAPGVPGVSTCNREWPCNHCQKRKVANSCRFTSVLDERAPAVDLKRNGTRQSHIQQAHVSIFDVPEYLSDYDENEDDDDDDDDDGGTGFTEANIERLGYSAAHFLADAIQTTEKKRKPGVKQYARRQADCPQLDHALQVLPPRPYSDALVQHFLNVVNFHYYIIHPQSFVTEYEQWWNDRIIDRPLSLPWTSLLLMICACSAQLPDADLRVWLERDLGQTMPKLSEKYHTAGRDLYNIIPVGHSHLFTVQQLLHSCYWYKSEARYIDSWHTLTAAVRVAQELGIHQESVVPVASDSERELRRRAWCMLSNWDWQIGALLSRPLILDPTECDVQLPNLSLEDYVPSPVLAIKLQSELIWTLSRRFGRPANVTAASAVEEYKGIVEAWASRFPQPYTFENTDKRMDVVCPWITLHRFYLHTMSFSTALDPIRPFLSKTFTSESPEIEHTIRVDGVKYALKLMAILFEFFKFVYPRERVFHSVLFYIFDIAALLCSAMLHDKDELLPSREECLNFTDASRNLLGHVSATVPTARKPFELLSRLAKKVASIRRGGGEDHTRKRPRVVTAPVSKPVPGHATAVVTPLYATKPESTPSYAAHQEAPSSEPWIVVTPGMHSISPQYQQPEHSTFGPSPSSGMSCANGSFVLSTSPHGEVHGTPSMGTLPFNNESVGGPFSDEQFQDISFANITEADLGNLASIWGYHNLNLDYVAPYPGS